ncbi:MAG: SCP2 sterol-binding domain-containing protein [Promethearchaeota archaeon]
MKRLHSPSTYGAELVRGATSNAIAVIAGGIILIIPSLFLLIPGVSYDISDPSTTLRPAFSVFVILFSFGLFIIFRGTNRAISLSKRMANQLDEMPEILQSTASIPEDYPAGRSVALGVGRRQPRVIRQHSSSPQSGQPRSPDTATPGIAATRVVPSQPLAVRPARVGKAPSSGGSAPALSFEGAVQAIVDRYNQEKVRKKFKGWVKTLMMTFPDRDTSVLYKINGDEGIEMLEGVDEGAEVHVIINSDVFIKLLAKQINAIKAYSSGKLKVKGEMKNLLKLRRLMF